LEGRDDTWVYSNDVSTSKTYFNLLAGSYTFKVATKGITGKWSAPAEFNFTILPPWWKTWWAYLTYTLLTILGIRGIVQYRSRQLKRENRLLEEKVSQRTEELKSTIDHLKATQSQLIHSEKMASLGELTAGIAHEIQNPLNFVNNFSEINHELLEEAEVEMVNGNLDSVQDIIHDLKKNEQKISEHGKRADSIVKGMLLHSRSATGEKIGTDINALCEEYLRLAYHGIRAKDRNFNADFETDFDLNLPLVKVVPQDIGRVLLNIINNAFQSLLRDNNLKVSKSQTPKVSITTKSIKDRIEISISDNGPGIPDDLKDKIFQPFFTTKPTGEGTGLGLSLSYDIVKAHGGELTCSSKVGEGSTFMIILPLNKS
jgi:signal transduction histidine kinase